MNVLFIILIIIAVLLILCGALIFIPAYIGIEYIIGSGENKAYIHIKLFKFIPLKIRLKTEKKKSEKPENKEKKKEKLSVQKYIATAKKTMEAYNKSKNEIFEILGDITKKVSFSELVFLIEFGTGNAASTGIMTGAVWSATDIFVSIIDRIFGVEKFNVNVTPYFDKKVFKGKFKSILKLRLWNIISILRKIMKVINTFNDIINNEKAVL